MQVLNPQLADDLAHDRPVSIAIGAGGERDEGHYTLDIRDMDGIDIVADLNEPLDGLPDRSVRSVHAHHVLEHVRELDALMDELHRVLRPDGVLQVIVPHWANPLGHSDPTHVRLFGLYSFGYFVGLDDQPFERKVPTYRDDHRFRILSLSLGFRSTGRFGSTVQRQVNRSMRRMELYERNAARVYWPYEIRCELAPA